MLRAKWRKFGQSPFIPPLLVSGTAALMTLAVAQLAAAAQPPGSAAVSDCGAPELARRAAARHVGPAPALAAMLDARGQFLGRGVSIAAPGRTISVALPAESFVGSPQGDALVYTLAAGGSSEIHVVDLGSGCDALIARPAQNVRSALLTPSGDAIYVHSVSAGGRADLGVARYELADGTVSVALPPLPADERFGVTFGTQLGWSTDAATLFVQSCGAQACRTRTLDIAGGAAKTYDQDGQGQIIGLSRDHLLTFADCTGLPCAVVSTDLESGARTTLVARAWSATLSGDGADRALADIETADGMVEVAQ